MLLDLFGRFSQSLAVLCEICKKHNMKNPFINKNGTQLSCQIVAIYFHFHINTSPPVMNWRLNKRISFNQLFWMLVLVKHHNALVSVQRIQHSHKGHKHTKNEAYLERHYEADPDSSNIHSTINVLYKISNVSLFCVRSHE